MTRKRSQVGTFGSHLQQFARSLDIAEDSTVDHARLLVYEYLRDQLDATYFELVLDHVVNDAPGLKTVWSRPSRNFATLIRLPDGSYSSQTALSFGTGKPLWIVSPDRRPLRHADSYQDMWSHLTDLPPYRPPIDEDLLTCVLIPMWRPGNRVLGVMAFESRDHLDITHFDRQELIMLADALGVLLDLRQLNDVQAQGKREAISNLIRIKDSVVFPQIAKPQVLVAFSSRADQQVVGLVLDELGKQGDRLRILPWNHIDDTGTISSHLAQAISTSQFGVCYLSEPDGQGGYQDNPNVLFESGMLHAISLSTQDQAAWLPIREEKSPPPPFDFAGDRIEWVPLRPDPYCGGPSERGLRPGREQRCR